VRRIAFVLGLAALVAAPALPAAAAAKEHRIVMANMGFGRAPAGIKVGDTVIWVNKDIFRHTATSKDKSFDVDVPPGKEGRTVVKRPGQFAYYCRFHPGMTATLSVGR
jgi:plastocyanin